MLKFFDSAGGALRALGARRRADVLTGFIGLGAAAALTKLGCHSGRLVFGLAAQSGLTEEQADVVGDLKRAGFDVRVASGLHSKVYLFDGEYAVVGSANLTRNGFGSLSEAVVATNSPSVVRDAQDYFDRIWRTGRTPPSAGRRKASRASRVPAQEPIGLLGRASGGVDDLFRGSVSSQGGASRSRRALGHPRVRLCAYDPVELSELNSANEVTWTSGAGLEIGDVQVFCVMGEFDAVHSIWRAVSKLRRIPGNKAWPIQADFELLVRLKRPISKLQLARAGVLASPNWPQGKHGRFLNENEKKAFAKIAGVTKAQGRRIRLALGV